MARNLKRDYLKKLLSIETKNGFKVDVNNYVGNISFNHDYPNLVKKIEDTEKWVKVRYYRYFKFYDGNGEYQVQDVVFPKKENDNSVWNVGHNLRDETLIENVRRFSMKKLIELAEADE